MIQNLWESFCFSSLDKLKGKDFVFLPAKTGDNLDNYKKMSADKRFVTYSPEDFSYKSNSLGFRCPEFDNNDKVKLLFSGCSFTHGLGLPIEHTWPSFMCDIISEEYGFKPTPYNVGFSGASIDMICRMIYLILQKKMFEPDAVFILFPTFFRKEIPLFEDQQLEALQILPAVDYQVANKKVISQNLYKLPNEFFLFEAIKNLLFLKGVCESRGIKFFFSFWDNPIKTTINLMGNDVVFIDRAQEFLPTELHENFIVADFVKDVPTELIPEDKRFKQNIARDFAHYGPNSQYYFAKQMFEKTKKHLDSIYRIIAT